MITLTDCGVSLIERGAFEPIVIAPVVKLPVPSVAVTSREPLTPLTARALARCLPRAQVPTFARQRCPAPPSGR